MTTPSLLTRARWRLRLAVLPLRGLLGRLAQRIERWRARRPAPATDDTPRPTVFAVPLSSLLAPRGPAHTDRESR